MLAQSHAVLLCKHMMLLFLASFVSSKKADGGIVVKEALNASLRDKDRNQQALETHYAKVNESLSADKVLP